jgi:hypothetical protein
VQAAAHISALDCAISLLHACVMKQPLCIARGSIASSVMGVQLTAENSLRNILVLNMVHIIASHSFASPDSASCDSFSSANAASWPDILNSKIVIETFGIDPLNTLTVETMVVYMLLGSSAFRALCKTLIAEARADKSGCIRGGIVLAGVMFNALSHHFFSNSSKLYCGAVKRFCSALCDTAAAYPYPTHHSPEMLVVILRCMMHLTLSGNIPFDFLASCSSFLSSCGAVDPGHSELNVAIAAFSEIVHACFPAIDPQNDKPFHIVWLSRNVNRLCF